MVNNCFHIAVTIIPPLRKNDTNLSCTKLSGSAAATITSLLGWTEGEREGGGGKEGGREKEREKERQTERGKERKKGDTERRGGETFTRMAGRNMNSHTIS